MEFVERSPEPKLLSKNKEKWTKVWLDFYRKEKNEDGTLIRDKKPNDSHWTKDEIRKILISDFKNNCGYCGCSRPTPKADNDSRTSSRGHVDHYRSKAIHPELTYDWNNYIWSCEACNVEKGEFDDPISPILNPCQKEDCNQLNFIIATGEYCLKYQESCYHMRFINTDKSTMLNANEITVRRRNRVKNMRSLFSHISTLLNFNHLKDINLLITEHISSIKNYLEDPEFYFLMQREYKILLNQYPEIDSLIIKTDYKL